MNKNKDTNYFDQKEEEDFEKLCQFNEKYQWFSELGRLARFSPLDCTAITEPFGMVYVELKDRDAKYDTWFIEPEKLEKMMLMESQGYPAFYCNFYKDDAYICRPFTATTNETYVSIYDKGHKQRKNVRRYEIPLSDFKKYTLI